MKNFLASDDMNCDDDITEELLDKSNEAATEFLDNTIFPLMDDFESNNDNPDYVPGIASFMLYVYLIEHLSENGWSADELKQTIDEFSSESNANRVLH
jgi:hypothetical protein